MAIAIPGLILVLVALLVLGGLAAVVYALVYAIANKRPGVALAAVLLPLVAMAGFGLLAGLLIPAITYRAGPSPQAHMSYHEDAPRIADTGFDFDGGAAPMVVHTDVALLKIIGVALLILFGLFAVVSLLRRKSDGERRGGWGKAIALLLLLIVVANVFVWRASHVPGSVAQRQAAAAQEMAEQARLQAEEAQRKAEELQNQPGAAGGQSMQELWEKLNQPRIKLEANDQSASMTIGDGPNKLEMRAGEPSGAKLAVPVSEKTAESLSNSITRLERMVRQVSSVAEQVSDVGTLIGRAMVALNDSLESQPQPPAKPQPPAQPPIAAAKPPEPAEPAVPAALSDASEQVFAASTSQDLVGESHADAGETSTFAPPGWIDDPPTRVGNTWRQVVVAGEYATTDECNRVSDIYLLLVTYNHLQQLVGNSLNDESLPALTLQGEHVYAGGHPIVVSGQPADYRLRLLAEMGIGIDYVRREIAKEEYVETVERSFGPMNKLYTSVEFSPSVDTELRRRWDEYRRQERFAVVGTGAGSVLGLLGLVYGLLKADTWTRGYYTKRLFLGVPAVIIGLLALLGFAAS